MRSSANKKRTNALMIGLVLPILSLMLMTLACVGETKLGNLASSASPQPFVLRGEVDSVWQVDVTENHRYTVAVKPQNTKHPLDQIDIWITNGKTRINTTPKITDNSINTNFIALASGSITIRLYSKIGERQENLGEFTIQITEVS